MQNHTIQHKDSQMPYWHSKVETKFTTNNHDIQFLMSTLTGKETLVVNGKQYSTKFNFTGASCHCFSLEGQQYKIKTKGNDFSSEFFVSLYKGEVLLEQVKWTSPDSTFFVIMLACFAAIFSSL